MNIKQKMIEAMIYERFRIHDDHPGLDPAHAMLNAALNVMADPENWAIDPFRNEVILSWDREPVSFGQLTAIINHIKEQEA